MSYPYVHIVNSTPYNGQGKVEYASSLCSDDDYKINAHGHWTADSRGVCLVTKISAKMDVFGTTYDAKPYTSSPGTSYSQFLIAQVGDNEFVVTRIVSSAEANDTPADYVAPTTKQK